MKRANQKEASARSRRGENSVLCLRGMRKGGGGRGRRRRLDLPRGTPGPRGNSQLLTPGRGTKQAADAGLTLFPRARPPVACGNEPLGRGAGSRGAGRRVVLWGWHRAPAGGLLGLGVTLPAAAYNTTREKHFGNGLMRALVCVTMSCGDPLGAPHTLFPPSRAQWVRRRPPGPSYV